MQEKFWLIWNERHGPPTVKQLDRHGAKAEAERLAKLHRGETFHVLELLGSVTVSDVHWDVADRNDDGIPF